MDVKGRKGQGMNWEIGVRVYALCVRWVTLMRTRV